MVRNLIFSLIIISGTWKLWQIDIRFIVGEEPHVLLTVQLQSNITASLPFKIANSNLKIELSPNKELTCVSTSSNLLFFNTKDGSVYGYIHNAHPGMLAIFLIFLGEITGFTWSPDGKYIISCATGDMTAKVWSVDLIPKL